MKFSLRQFWLWLPFPAMTLLTVFLFFVKEEFPFSNFPMYSNFDNEADVLFVTDQTDAPVPMDRVFRTGSAATKKTYKGELARLVNPEGRDTKDATAAERSAAGQVVLQSLKKRIKAGTLPEGTTALRLFLRTFRLEDGVFHDDQPEQLAEVQL
ncbi:MAG: hypothetical protein KDK99_10505 [Verrucomicrobiales bacterium]|nr:hypothetical protein [Verrucomicrobiales bacterium]